MGPCLHDGRYELRQARDRAEIAAAQTLRYRVFMEEGGAMADMARRSLRRDIDRLEAYCDHLIVIDRAASGQIGPPCSATIGS
ncbi:GNAT family N-acyltransferase [Geminicoccus harenae]|uniref:GNAT family N-acyltransferase n=1 Tax=Geminicoccus harenae TaxID=2498453 RepID=UPI001C954219|nr:GNAT family N-acyltransferase [Geminicoccus harenae]